MLTLVFLRFIGEKFEDGVSKLRQELIEQGFDPDDEYVAHPKQEYKTRRNGAKVFVFQGIQVP